jgi:hypothetical protein
MKDFLLQLAVEAFHGTGLISMKLRCALNIHFLNVDVQVAFVKFLVDFLL